MNAARQKMKTLFTRSGAAECWTTFGVRIAHGISGINNTFQASVSSWLGFLIIKGIQHCSHSPFGPFGIRGINHGLRQPIDLWTSFHSGLMTTGQNSRRWKWLHLRTDQREEHDGNLQSRKRWKLTLTVPFLPRKRALVWVLLFGTGRGSSLHLWPLGFLNSSSQ